VLMSTWQNQSIRRNSFHCWEIGCII